MSSLWLIFLVLFMPGFLKASENSAGIYVLQWKAECQYNNDGQDIVLMLKHYYNAEFFIEYDSRKGKFSAKTDFGKIDAEYWNNNTQYIDQLHAQVDTVCRHNYEGLKEPLVDLKIVPEVAIITTKNSGGLSMLMCFVSGFYPPKMGIQWLRNGEEVKDDVVSTGIIQNGDWTYQIQLTLETVPKAGEKYSCKVNHDSLKEPLIVDWNPALSPSAKNKLITGAGGFVLGGIFIIVGLVIYLRNRKVATRIPVSQSEGLMS
ncbi:H-2 class II histocompatibility antigen, E-S beta chain-like [Protopterus annectens]|uniref:H-2 class II histocompatibility antigen, E-S beta chain-like n=1 Tax=Protopterus annectens TaxID=7888 RepID=UPI001CFBC6E7|nr:H-2 class II histocompatibility antigen, E-S beta chain-like [Protopterus annectens]